MENEWQSLPPFPNVTVLYNTAAVAIAATSPDKENGNNSSMGHLNMTFSFLANVQ